MTSPVETPAEPCPPTPCPPHPGPADADLGLPDGWHPVTPSTADADELCGLLRRHEEAARGRAGTLVAQVRATLEEVEGQERCHLVVRDETGRARAWATVHDRAAARAVVAVVVDPALDQHDADRLAGTLFEWAEQRVLAYASSRGVDVTQMDSGAFADDERQQRWLGAAGFSKVRTWLQMSRPVRPEEADPDVDTDPTVTVRQVRRGEDGMPEAADLQAVHEVLEEAFTDHFNYHPETFDEFLARLRADPGHRWDHWWIAEITEVDDPGATPVPGGALVGAVSPGADGSPEGSYVEYLGVLRSARGRGVATSLLTTVVADAARRGRERVGLEVDADSPTGAVGLYTSMGFEVSYRTESWHRDVAAR